MTMPDDFNPNMPDPLADGPTGELQRIADGLLHDINDKEAELRELYRDLNGINLELLRCRGCVRLWVDIPRAPTIRIAP